VYHVFTKAELEEVIKDAEAILKEAEAANAAQGDI